jgi:hypothetical protein
VIAGPSCKARAGGKSGHRGFRSQGRESMGNAPGNARGAAVHVMRAVRFTESATENKPPVGWSTVASSRETCKTPAKADSAVRVKRWGKSPPLVWRQTRHGKPRVVQGQIGGESRPGSMSSLRQTPFVTAQAAAIENPRVGCWSRGANHGLEE